MADLKYLCHALYILINYSFKQVVDIFKNKVYCQESYILIISFHSKITVTGWLDGRLNLKANFKNPSRGSIPANPTIFTTRC
jgi:hypothetical protein